ncbi:MAG: PKD domain-containing protein [Methanoregula sp.]|jgi:PKD repeat protein
MRENTKPVVAMVVMTMMKMITKMWKPVAVLLLIASAICAVAILSGDFNPSAKLSNVEENQQLSSINVTIPAEHLSLDIMTPINRFIINTTVPQTPAIFPYYKVIYQKSDITEKVYGPLIAERFNETPADIAPELAKQALEPYGGLPSDAVLMYSTTLYGISTNSTTGEIIYHDPITTDVLFYRNLNGTTIKGMHDMASVIFGENGEVLQLTRVWGTLQYTGRDLPVISVYDAIRKLDQRDIMNPVSDAADFTVNSTYLGHYGNKWAAQPPEIYLEPVWVFTGTFPSGNYYEFYVYARQFANITATPTTGKVPLTVTFTDTSETTPNEWLWDFGDGTNSTEQNPAHTYTTAGTYNVSLKAWNDLGSDTMEKTDYITVRNPAAPVATFTGTPTTGSAPLSVTFNDTSTNLPTSWFWTFGDGTNATEQNPTHTYTAPGNYTVSLNVTNDDGTNSVTKPEYITVSNLPPTTLTTAPTTIVTTTATTTVTTTPTTTTTTKPTPTRTHAPLSPAVAIVGIMVIGMLHTIRQKKNR